MAIEFSELERLLNKGAQNFRSGQIFTVESKNGLPVVHIHPQPPPIDPQIIFDEIEENGF